MPDQKSTSKTESSTSLPGRSTGTSQDSSNQDRQGAVGSQQGTTQKPMGRLNDDDQVEDNDEGDESNKNAQNQGGPAQGTRNQGNQNQGREDLQRQNQGNQYQGGQSQGKELGGSQSRQGAGSGPNQSSQTRE